MVEQPAPAGSPGQARPRSPSKVRRLAENWHSAPIIEDDGPRPHPLLSEDHLAAVAKRPEPPKPVTDDDDSTHPLLDASRDTLVTEVSNETQPLEPEIVVVSAPPDIVNISISGESLRADTPEPDEAEPPPPPPPLVFESPERPVPPAVAPVAPPPRVPRAMSEQRDRSSDFEPLRFLGKGTFGAVVLVRRRSRLDAPGEGRRYAMKVLLKRKLGEKSRREMAMVEREILRSVRHPFLVSLACSFQSKTRLYLVTPYFCGGDLDARLKERKQLVAGEVRAHIARLSLAVDFLHRSGVIHRDIKGANVLLDAGGRAHLADFGLAAYCDDASRGRKLSFAGTLDYMAPELFLKSVRTYDGSVDYWSLGVLAYQCLVGVTPFHGKTARELFTNILKSEPDMEPVLEDARDGVRALLAKNPQERDRLHSMRRRPFFGEAIQVWRRVADADDPLAQSTIPDPATPEQAVPDRDFDRYLSHDGERQPDLRADLFAGYAYRAPDQRGDATSPMILRPPPRRKHPLLDQASMTSDGSSFVSVTVSRDSRDSLSLSASGSGVSSRSGSNSLSSSASDRSVKRGHRRTTSRAMGSIIAMSRTASLKIKNAAKAAKKTMSVRRSRDKSPAPL